MELRSGKTAYSLCQNRPSYIQKNFDKVPFFYRLNRQKRRSWPYAGSTLGAGDSLKFQERSSALATPQMIRGLRTCTMHIAPDIEGLGFFLPILCCFGEANWYGKINLSH
jgi:hypothetical protein